MFVMGATSKGGVGPEPNKVSLLLSTTGVHGGQNNIFLDSSGNNLAITRNGKVTQGTFSPFAPSGEYNASVHGGSGYFDGSTAYLGTVTSYPALVLSTGDFTVQGWCYHTNRDTNRGIFQIGGNVGGLTPNPATTLSLLVLPDGRLHVYATGDPNGFGSTTVVALNTWFHFALVRASGVIKLYINGNLDTGMFSSGQASDTYNYSGQYVAIGGSYGTAHLWSGYISNFSVVKGTALYTTNFTPPTAPLTAIANTSLLLNFTNANIIDYSRKNNLVTVGHAQVSTLVKKFGTGSMYFEGNGDYLVTPSTEEFGFGIGDFTVEAHVYRTGSVLDFSGIVDTRRGGNAGFCLYVRNDGLVGYADNERIVAYGGWCPLNTWLHVAVCRVSGNISVFVDGISVISITDTRSMGAKASITIGGDGLYFFTGYIDDLRITKGEARYIANFTPPTAAFPRQ